MEKLIAFLSVLSLLSWVEISEGAVVFKRVLGKCRVKRNERVLIYNGSDDGLCKWDIQQQYKPQKALVLYIKKLSFANCTANLSLPGADERCTTSTKPLCHVYTSNGTICDKSEMIRGVQVVFPECTSARVHGSDTKMDMIFKATGKEYRSFQIAFRKISCKENSETGSGENGMTTGVQVTSISSLRNENFLTGSGFETNAGLQTRKKIELMTTAELTTFKPNFDGTTGGMPKEHARVSNRNPVTTVQSATSESPAFEKTSVAFLAATKWQSYEYQGTSSTNFNIQTVTISTKTVELDSTSYSAVGESWIIVIVVVLVVLTVIGITASLILCMSLRKTRNDNHDKNDALPGYLVTKA